MELRLESTLLHSVQLDKEALRELMLCVAFRRQHASGIDKDHPIHRLADTLHHYLQTLEQYEPLLSGVRTEALPSGPPRPALQERAPQAAPETAEEPKNPEAPSAPEGAAPPPPPPFPIQPPPAAPPPHEGEPRAQEAPDEETPQPPQE